MALIDEWTDQNRQHAVAVLHAEIEKAEKDAKRAADKIYQAQAQLRTISTGSDGLIWECCHCGEWFGVDYWGDEEPGDTCRPCDGEEP